LLPTATPEISVKTIETERNCGRCFLIEKFK